MVEFDKEFASLSPEQFAAKYLTPDSESSMQSQVLIFRMAIRGTGNMDRLKRDSNGLIEVTKVEKVECQGEKISSTCIRERLLNGKCRGAA